MRKTPLLDDLLGFFMAQHNIKFSALLLVFVNAALISKFKLGHFPGLSLVLGNGIVVYAIYLGRVHLVRIAPFTVDIKSRFVS